MMHYEFFDLIQDNCIAGLREKGLLHEVSCGLFGISEDHFESYNSLDERFIKNKASTFFFEAKGESMEPIIFEKDVLIVDRAMTPVNGQIIVASINGSFICKTYFKQRGQIILRSENRKERDLVVTKEMSMNLFGVVIGIYRECSTSD